MLKRLIPLIMACTLTSILQSGCKKPQTTSLPDAASVAPMVTEEQISQTVGTRAQPPVLVYKTRKDYACRVPVEMDATKTRIVSYPHPSDLFLGKSLALPTPLTEGYLLDNRGIGPNVAFLTYSYETYSRLSSAPDMKKLTDSILDKSPLTELWICGYGNALRHDTGALNRQIRNRFPDCKSLMESRLFNDKSKQK